MNALYSSVLVFIFVTALYACNNSHENENIDLLVKDYFTALQNNDIEKVMGFYSPEFFNSRSPEQWRQRLTDLLQQNGKITKVLLINKQADTRFSGKFFIYQYYTVHAQKRFKHTLTWIHAVDDNQVKLVGHMIKQK